MSSVLCPADGVQQLYLQYALYFSFSDNFLKIDIYYGQLQSELVEQKEAYDAMSFLSKLFKCIFVSTLHKHDLHVNASS